MGTTRSAARGVNSQKGGELWNDEDFIGGKLIITA
jgi:hypothetical protein